LTPMATDSSITSDFRCEPDWSHASSNR
jgi:hypothetical protein